METREGFKKPWDEMLTMTAWSQAAPGQDVSLLTSPLSQHCCAVGGGAAPSIRGSGKKDEDRCTGAPHLHLTSHGAPWRKPWFLVACYPSRGQAEQESKVGVKGSPSGPGWLAAPSHSPSLCPLPLGPASVPTASSSALWHLLSKETHCYGAQALDSWNKLCLATLLDTEVSNPMEYDFNFQLEIRGPCLLAGDRQLPRLEGSGEGSPK